MSIDTSKTGAAIAAHRQRMNLSQQGLAGLMNVTHQAVSKWEKGLALPDTETLLLLAKLFGTSMENLLTGLVPQEPERKPEEEILSNAESSSVQPSPADFSSELENLDLSSVINMLPFVSAEVADRLFLTCIAGGAPAAGMLGRIAPFVSKETLSDYVRTHPFKTLSPELVGSLAPFLTTEAVDDMISNLEEPLSPHVMQMLLPFASTKGVDQMVMARLGVFGESASRAPAALSQQIQSAVQQQIRQQFDGLEKQNSGHPSASDAGRAAESAASRENPRTRLIRKALAHHNYEIIESRFDELDDEAFRMLLDELAKTGDAELLQLLCSNAGELPSAEQSSLVQLLIKGGLYGRIAEIISDLQEDVQQLLVDQAFESSDPELLKIVSQEL